MRIKVFKINNLESLFVRPTNAMSCVGHEDFFCWLKMLRYRSASEIRPAASTSEPPRAGVHGMWFTGELRVWSADGGRHRKFVELPFGRA
jgi:hypothetical protein